MSDNIHNIKDLILWLKDGYRRIVKYNRDYVAVITGMEGAGKSTLALLLGQAIDKNFSMDKIIFDYNDYLNLVLDRTRHDNKESVIMFDETALTSFSRNSQSDDGKDFVQNLIINRYLNNFQILILPSLKWLDVYPREHRTMVLFHCLSKENIQSETENRYLAVYGKHKLIDILKTNSYHIMFSSFKSVAHSWIQPDGYFEIPDFYTSGMLSTKIKESYEKKEWEYKHGFFRMQRERRDLSERQSRFKLE